MALATLSVDLEARVAKYAADMGQAARVTERNAQQISRSLLAIQTAASGVSGLLGGLAAGISIGGMVALTRSTINGLDAMNDLKDATGSSIENISALEDIAARTGTTFDTVGASLVKFNNTLKEAKKGSDAEAAFHRLNLDIEELRRLDPAEALRRTAVALQGFADDGDRARFVQELFGKSVKEVAPFLKDLAEAGQLNATVTAEQAQAAEDFNKQIFALQKNIKDAARYLSGDFVTAINAAGKAMREGGFLAGVRVLFGGDAGFQQNKAFVEAVDKKVELEQEIQSLRAKGFNDDSRGMRTAQAQLAAVNAQISAMQTLRDVTNPDNQSAAETARLSRRPSIGNPFGADKAAKTPSTIDFTNRAVEQYIVTLDKQLERENELSEVEKARNELLRIGAVSLEQASKVFDRADQLDQAKARELANKAREHSIALEADYLKGLAADSLAQEANNKKLAEQIEEMGLTTDALERLRLARLDAVIAQEKQNLVMDAATRGHDEEIRQAEKRIELLQKERDLTARAGDRRVELEGQAKSDEFAKTLNSDVKGALSNAFRDTTKGPLVAFGDAIGNVIFTRMTNAAATAFADVLVGNGKPGGGNGLIGAALSFFGFPSFAVGTDYVPHDMLAMIHKGEKITPASENRRGASGGPVNHYYFNVGDVASVSMVKQAIAQSQRQVFAATQRSMNYGGAYAA